MNARYTWKLSFALLCFVAYATGVQAADWPMWRYNANRGASSPDALSSDLHLKWVRTLTPAQPAWPPTQPRLQFDAAAQPVAAEGRLFVPCSTHDTVTAYDLANGKQLWQFFTEGPVRFAPIAARGRVWFVSDDGYLYCVSADEGHLLWKFRGGPAQRAVLGNQRIVSSWPARGGPVLHDDKIYFAASIWSFMGIFVHAVDSHTGEAVWTNSGDGTNWTVHPHGAPSFGTVVPQGHLTITGNHLIVPGGRSVPAVYDTRTGKLLHFVYDKKLGGHEVTATSGLYFVGGSAYAAQTGKNLGGMRPAVLDGTHLLTSDGSRVRGFTLEGVTKATTPDRRGNTVAVAKLTARENFQSEITGKVFLSAGQQIYSASNGEVAAYDIAKTASGKVAPKKVWSASVDGDVWTMLAANEHLIVVTKDNRIWCFGADKVAGQPQRLVEIVDRIEPGDNDMAARASEILEQSKTTTGYCVALGIGSGKLIEAILAKSELDVMVVDADAEKVDAFRRRMHSKGLYGLRVSAHVGNPATYSFPRYLANLVISEEANVGGIDPATYPFDVLRPYGGRAVFALSSTQQASASGRTDFQVKTTGKLTHVIRAGALADSDDWSHQYGNAAQTAISDEFNVKPPFGVLWFGGVSHEGVLPRHGHGPSPQVAGGRLFIEGVDFLRCTDVYTGRLLWKKDMPGFGTYYNITGHFAGAGEIGSNFVSLEDAVYAIYGSAILKLDPATGKTVEQFTLPATASGRSPHWGYLGVLDDVLVATSSPVGVTGSTSKGSPRPPITKLRSTDVPLIKLHDTWSYLAGKEPAKDWTSLKFDASKWPTGTAGFGFGDGDDRTQLKMAGKYARVYIRRQFDLPAGAASAEAGLVINYDDAFIAYLNGREIVRVGVGSGRGATAKKVSQHEASGHVYIPLKNWKSLVVPGKNVLAIEGHNTSITSSDFTLDPALVIRGGKNVVQQPPKDPAPTSTPRLPTTQYASGSRHMLALDRHDGAILWRREAKLNFRHNNIALAAGKVFCIDDLTQARQQALSRRGIKLADTPKLYALDIRTGEEIWSTEKNVTGTFLSYSHHHDILVQAGSAYRDRARDESQKGIIAYRGKTGEVLWSQLDLSYNGPCMLLKDRIVTNGGGGFAIDIQTGKPTGWKFTRQYGCNTAIGCQNLLTFRSGAAGFCDLVDDSGTGNLGGFRSSCTANLIPANGILNAPDYTRTCSCAYQNQTSLALVHMPQAEFWTFGGEPRDGRWGVNFNAPGDRRSKQGTLWTAKSNLTVEPQEVELFRLHSSLVNSDASLPWVAASGLIGVKRLTIPVKPGRYAVSLRYLEPDVKSTGRVFDVSLQGKTVLADLDVVKATGGTRRELTRQFEVEAKEGKIVIEMNAKTGKTIISGVEWSVVK